MTRCRAGRAAANCAHRVMGVVYAQTRLFTVPRSFAVALEEEGLNFFDFKRGIARHDLHVTTIYLHMLRNRPADAEAWISEDLLAPSRRHQKLPDAMLQFADGRPSVVIEFAGS